MKIESFQQAGKTSPYIDWLACLYAIFEKTRKQGWLVIEDDIESPSAECSVFSYFPQTLQQPYFDFAVDLLCQQLKGHELEWCTLYSEQAKAALLNTRLSPLSRRFTVKKIDANLVDMIVAVFQQGIRGYDPRSLADLARLYIPLNKRPSRDELDEFLFALKKQLTQVNDYDDLDLEAESFIDSLSD